MNHIRTLLVDNNLEFLRSTAGFLSTFSTIVIIGQVESGYEALNKANQLEPDLVLMDLRMLGINGLETTRLIKLQRHPPRIVILTIHNDPQYRASAKRAGADGFISKSQMGVELLPLIQSLFPERCLNRD